MLIFSVSFQFFRMSPRRGRLYLITKAGPHRSFAFGSAHGCAHVTCNLSQCSLPRHNPACFPSSPRQDQTRFSCSRAAQTIGYQRTRSFTCFTTHRAVHRRHHLRHWSNARRCAFHLMSITTKTFQRLGTHSTKGCCTFSLRQFGRRSFGVLELGERIVQAKVLTIW